MTVVVNKARQEAAVVWTEKAGMDIIPLGGGKLLKVLRTSH